MFSTCRFSYNTIRANSAILRRAHFLVVFPTLSCATRSIVSEHFNSVNLAGSANEPFHLRALNTRSNWARPVLLGGLRYAPNANQHTAVTQLRPRFQCIQLNLLEAFLHSTVFRLRAFAKCHRKQCTSTRNNAKTHFTSASIISLVLPLTLLEMPQICFPFLLQNVFYKNCSRVKKNTHRHSHTNILAALRGRQSFVFFTDAFPISRG